MKDSDPGWPKDITCSEAVLVLGATAVVTWILSWVVLGLFT